MGCVSCWNFGVLLMMMMMMMIRIIIIIIANCFEHKIFLAHMHKSEVRCHTIYFGGINAGGHNLETNLWRRRRRG